MVADMTRSDYRKVAICLRDQRKLWRGHNEARAAIDGLVVALAKEYSATKGARFKVAQWLEDCGTILHMGWLPASLERDKGKEAGQNVTK